MKAVIFVSALILTFSAIPATAQDCMCGDINCDGAYNMGDAVYLLDYIFGGGPPPLTETFGGADWDEHEELTIADVWDIVKFVFGEAFPTCPPPNPPLDPPIDSSLTLYYTDWVPWDESSATIVLTLWPDAGNSFLYGISLPLKIRVGGEIPMIDSISVMHHSIYPDSGYVAIGMIPFIEFFQGFPGQIARIYLTIPPDLNDNTVTMEWVNLTPIQAPTTDSSVIPLVYLHPGAELAVAEPLLEPHCCLTPGDANMDGVVNIGDAVYNLQCIFVDCLGHPCEKHLDANCDGTWNVADIVWLINYIFKGGDPPCCL